MIGDEIGRSLTVLAEICDGLGVVLVGPVREVHTGDVHPGLDELAKHLHALGLGPNGADKLCRDGTPCRVKRLGVLERDVDVVLDRGARAPSPAQNNRMQGWEIVREEGRRRSRRLGGRGGGQWHDTQEVPPQQAFCPATSLLNPQQK